MWSVIMVSLFVIFLSFLVMGIGWGVSARSYSDREKSSPFECGFDSLGSSRAPFSLRFFLLAVVFLIFDVEVVLLFPFISNSLCQHNLMLVFGGYFFLGILLVGLIHEWKEGSLDWAV
uniref:NADH-ubiquinone oxidoreductase chain 3 n=1 Tax=Cellana nigrlineata TaxID=1933376 RepID=A0A7R7YQE1_9GAST|nr:NADH dehydrogenase subunit 3 [Cellana nigrolineata]